MDSFCGIGKHLPHTMRAVYVQNESVMYRKIDRKEVVQRHELRSLAIALCEI